MIYGYCRISTKRQSIDRQIRNISEKYKGVKLYCDTYTGKTLTRPEWLKLMKDVTKGDTIVFDSVSRMSRNAEEGVATYMELYDKGIELVFLKEPAINTSVYTNAMHDAVPMTGGAVDYILKGINDYMKALAKEQINLAFGQSQKEVDDLRQRTKEGLVTAKKKGKTLGRQSGKKVITKISVTAKKVILDKNKTFGGPLNDEETMILADISKNTFYKYKKELIEQLKKEGAINA